MKFILTSEKSQKWSASFNITTCRGKKKIGCILYGRWYFSSSAFYNEIISDKSNQTDSQLRAFNCSCWWPDKKIESELKLLDKKRVLSERWVKQSFLICYACFTFWLNCKQTKGFLRCHRIHIRIIVMDNLW